MTESRARVLAGRARARRDARERSAAARARRGAGARAGERHQPRHARAWCSRAACRRANISACAARSRTAISRRRSNTAMPPSAWSRRSDGCAGGAPRPARLLPPSAPGSLCRAGDSAGAGARRGAGSRARCSPPTWRRRSTRSGMRAPRVGDRIAVVGAGVVGSLIAALAARIPGDRGRARRHRSRAAPRSPRRSAALSRCRTRRRARPISCSMPAAAPAGLATALALAGFEARVRGAELVRRPRGDAAARRGFPRAPAAASSPRRSARSPHRAARAAAAASGSLSPSPSSPIPASTGCSPARARSRNSPPRWPASPRHPTARSAT